MAYRHKAADEPEPDEDLLEHKDAIRLAHKCLKSAVAFLREGLEHAKRAADLLGDVCDALPDDHDTGDEGGERPTGDGGDERTFAAQRRRAAELRRRFGAL
jgi:hypothetical protein